MCYKIDQLLPCAVCGLQINGIKPVSGQYYLQLFILHLNNDHNLSINQYVYKYLNVENKCKCGCGQLAGFYRRGANLLFVNWINGHVKKSTNENFRKSCATMSQRRKGFGNPMRGRKAWNRGISHPNPNKGKTLEEMHGLEVAKEIRKKMSYAGTKRMVPGHLGHKHTEESKHKIRTATMKRYADGKFMRCRSLPHRTVESLLEKNNVGFISEYQLYPYMIDIYIPSIDVYIEVQGDFFHSNPKLYPDGPVSKIQKRNFARDEKKRDFLKSNNYTLIEIWECDILDGSYEKDLLCRLQK